MKTDFLWGLSKKVPTFFLKAFGLPELFWDFLNICFPCLVWRACCGGLSCNGCFSCARTRIYNKKEAFLNAPKWAFLVFGGSLHGFFAWKFKKHSKNCAKCYINGKKSIKLLRFDGGKRLAKRTKLWYNHKAWYALKREVAIRVTSW